VSKKFERQPRVCTLYYNLLITSKLYLRSCETFNGPSSLLNSSSQKYCHIILRPIILCPKNKTYNLYKGIRVVKYARKFLLRGRIYAGIGIIGIV